MLKIRRQTSKRISADSPTEGEATETESCLAGKSTIDKSVVRLSFYKLCDSACATRPFTLLAICMAHFPQRARRRRLSSINLEKTCFSLIKMVKIWMKMNALAEHRIGQKDQLSAHPIAAAQLTPSISQMSVSTSTIFGRLMRPGSSYVRRGSTNPSTIAS